MGTPERRATHIVKASGGVQAVVAHPALLVVDVLGGGVHQTPERLVGGVLVAADHLASEEVEDAAVALGLSDLLGRARLPVGHEGLEELLQPGIGFEVGQFPLGQ
jgi:hypothetical protein